MAPAASIMSSIGWSPRRTMIHATAAPAAATTTTVSRYTAPQARGGGVDVVEGRGEVAHAVDPRQLGGEDSQVAAAVLGRERDDPADHRLGLGAGDLG